MMMLNTADMSGAFSVQPQGLDMQGTADAEAGFSFEEALNSIMAEAQSLLSAETAEAAEVTFSDFALGENVYVTPELVDVPELCTILEMILRGEFSKTETDTDFLTKVLEKLKEMLDEYAEGLKTKVDSSAYESTVAFFVSVLEALYCEVRVSTDITVETNATEIDVNAEMTSIETDGFSEDDEAAVSGETTELSANDGGEEVAGDTQTETIDTAVFAESAGEEANVEQTEEHVYKAAETVTGGSSDETDAEVNAANAPNDSASTATEADTVVIEHGGEENVPFAQKDVDAAVSNTAEQTNMHAESHELKQESVKATAEKLFEVIIVKAEQVIVSRTETVVTENVQTEESELKLAVMLSRTFGRTVVSVEQKTEVIDEMNAIISARNAQNEQSAEKPNVTMISESSENPNDSGNSEKAANKDGIGNNADSKNTNNNNAADNEANSIIYRPGLNADGFKAANVLHADKANVPVTTQISEQITAAMTKIGDGVTQFEIQLAPEELGKVNIKLVAKGDKIDLQITAERPETAELLKIRTADMAEALKQNGTQLERYEVFQTTNESERGSYLQQESGQKNGQNQHDRETPDEQNDEQETELDTVSFLELMRSMV